MESKQTVLTLSESSLCSNKHQTTSELEGCPNPVELFRACCLALPILHPHGLFRLCWDTFIMFALIYTAIEIPLSIAFDIRLTLTNILGTIAFSIDVLLLLDIALNFRTQYYDKWDRLLLHTDPFDIAKKYFKGWFWLDLATSFPLEFIIDSQGEKSSDFATYIKVLRVFRLLRIFKILRVIRVMKMFDGLTNIFITREVYFVLRLFKIMGAMVLTAHYFACVWWYVGVQAYKDDIYSSWIQSQGIKNDDSLFIKYSYSWYWAIVTLFTTGYGDITANNPTEQWVCSICILTGSCFFAYFVGTLTTWVSEGDRVRGFEIEKVEEAQAFCRHHKFDRVLTRTVLTHVRYYCNYNFVFESEDILPLLPPFLQREVNARIAKRYLSELDLFSDLPTEIIGQIALTMHSISCNAGRYLYKRGDISTCMYLQRTGEAKLKYLDGTPSRRLKRGDVVGERALIAGKRRYDVLCTIWTEFFVLSIPDIKTIFVNNFKQKRAKFEWSKIRRTVRMSSTKHIKVTRRCNLANIAPSKHVSRRVIHELSRRGSSLHSDLLEKFAFSPRKKNNGSIIYTKINDNNNDGTDEERNGITTNEGKSTPVLDIDDASTPQLDITGDLSSYQNEFIEVKQEETEKMDFGRKVRASTEYMVSNRGRRMSEPVIIPKSDTILMNDRSSGSNSSVPRLHKMRGSATSELFSKISPFYVRHNSERRNEKVLSDTATTVFGKGRLQNNSSAHLMSPTKAVIDGDYSETEELDLDASTDGTDQDILAPLTSNTSKVRSNTASTSSTKRIGKFGGIRKPRKIPTKNRKQKSVSPRISTSKLMNNTVRFKDIQYIDSDNNNDEDDDDGDEEEENYINNDKLERDLTENKSPKLIKKLVELGKISESVVKINSYDTTQSASSGSGSDQEIELNAIVRKQTTDFEENREDNKDETNINNNKSEE